MAATNTFTLYASHGRIYAENVDGKLVDIGALQHTGDAWTFRLDADGIEGEALDTPAHALADIQERITFLYLDGQFTALPDVRDEARLTADAPQVAITLDTTPLPR